MQKNKNAFSLIELIIATGIISMTLFGIYKIIWENNRIIWNSDIFLSQNVLFQNAKECLKWKNFSGNRYLNFWEDFKNCNFTNDEKIITINWVDFSIFIEQNENIFKIIVKSSSISDLEKIVEK